MTQQNYPIPPPPPPPPPPTKAPIKKGLHGPGTKIFQGIRANLASLEGASQVIPNAVLKKGGIIALILGATLTFALSFVAQLATGLPSTDAGLLIIIAPITEELFKAISILIAALFIWKTIPSRRHGALLGAASGLGFAIAENILYTISYASAAGQVVNGQVIPEGYVAELLLSRWISIPFMHVLWSAFVGIGLFVLLARGKISRGTPWWMVAIFPLVGLANHILWNLVAALASGAASPFVSVVITWLLIFVPFAIVFRDFLGGHFNFQDFLHPVPEPSTYQQFTTFPPPPPPP